MATTFWLWRTFGEGWIEQSALPAKEDARAEQVDVRASVHLALEHLDPVHVALYGAGAPGQGEPSLDRIPVFTQAGSEGAQLGDLGGLDRLNPCTELLAASEPGAPPTVWPRSCSRRDVRSPNTSTGRCVSMSTSTVP